MKISLTTNTLQQQAATCLIVGIYEDGELTPTAKTIDKHTQGAITKLIKQGVIEGKLGQTLPLFQFDSFAQILLVGCGAHKSVTAMNFKKIIVCAIKTAANIKTTAITCYLNEIKIDNKSPAWKIRQITESTYDSLYKFDLFKSEKDPIVLQKLQIHLDDKKQLKACEKALNQGIAIADGMILAKNLGNTPSNICTPSFLAEQAKALAKEYKNLSVKILEENDMQKLGMGAILAVSQGSAEDAKLICLEYHGAGKTKAPVVLVGKGITFDTGGNSLKAPDAMVGMKYDMCGAATVLGTIKAAAELKLPIDIVGVIPAVENMPGGTAYKPEDILTTLSGQTVEVISTDAEGRLVLCDALTYCERYQPDVVIDIATLTGAVVIALGIHATGLVSNHDALAKALLDAGIESNDRAWQLPLWDEYQEQLKSPFADMTNSGGRMGGTITAGCFLSRFAKKFRWAHLDVAGTAAMMMSGGDRYATGRPIPMLVQYLLSRAK